MCGNVAVALFESFVLANPMQVVSTHNDRLLHFRGHDDSTEQTTANGNIAGKRAFFVDICAFDGVAGCFDAEADVAEPSTLSTTDATDEGNGALFRESLVVKNISHSG